MIAELLNRQFILDAVEDVKRDLEKSATGEGRRLHGELPPEAAELETDDYRKALELVRRAENQERAVSSGQPGFEPPPAGRRGGEAADLDEVSFFSRDPILSNVQSALEEYIETRQPADVEEERELPGGRRRGAPAAEETPVVAGRRLRDGQRGGDGRRIGEKFSITDPGWVSSLVALGLRRFRSKHPFNPEPAHPRRISDRVRLLVMGDWGSGLPRAVRVSEQMRRVLREGREQRLEQHVIHLGDVYYSGWTSEVNKRFLPHWPVTPAEAGEIGSWSLNANHDMYCGGYGYFDALLADRRFRMQGRSSFFSLANSRWRILGLDTGWEDGGLQEPQPGWIAEEADAAARAGQKVMLLSHHQLFSAFEKGGEGLRRRMGEVLGRGAVHSWLWGHEHREVIYRPHEGLQFSACLGNGGVPVYMTHRAGDPYPPPVTYENREHIKKGLESWALFGFAVLDFEEERFHLRLVDENGRTHHTQTVE